MTAIASFSNLTPFKIAAMVAGAVILTEFAFALWFYWM
jgi:hypothetical protein